MVGTVIKVFFTWPCIVDIKNYLRCNLTNTGYRDDAEGSDVPFSSFFSGFETWWLKKKTQVFSHPLSFELGAKHRERYSTSVVVVVHLDPSTRRSSSVIQTWTVQASVKPTAPGCVFVVVLQMSNKSCRCGMCYLQRPSNFRSQMSRAQLATGFPQHGGSQLYCTLPPTSCWCPGWLLQRAKHSLWSVSLQSTPAEWAAHTTLKVWRAHPPLDL